jgi:hypothetical protein
MVKLENLEKKTGTHVFTLNVELYMYSLYEFTRLILTTLKIENLKIICFTEEWYIQ